MAVAVSKPISTIGLALTGKSGSMDIPKPAGYGVWDARDTWAAVAARPAPGKTRRAELPTPPNSISPSLPPQAYRGTVEHRPLTPPAPGTESDIDLEEAVEHAAAQDQAARGYTAGSHNSSPVEWTGNITPTLLATYHLPNIVLGHGQVPIRHIIGQLMTSVPGFSSIPATKARRIVVGALESKSAANVEAGGGVDGDVIFEKVGWGKWYAYRKGEPSQPSSRQPSPAATRTSTKSPSPYASTAFHIPHRPRTSRNRIQSSASRSFSARSEHEVDRMSMDEGGSASSSEPPEDAFPEDDEGEVTDEEDWESMGAAALRAGVSFRKGATLHGKSKYDYNERVRRESSAQSYGQRSSRAGGGPSTSALAKSAPVLNDVDMKDLMEGVSKDEGEAVCALLQLGSV